MKIVRLMGVMMCFLAVGYVANQYSAQSQTYAKENAFSSDNIDIVDNAASYETKNISEDNRSNVEIIKYTNTNRYDVSLTSSDIIINFEGKGSTKEEDENIVKKNMKIQILFAENEDSNKLSKINVKRGQSVNIYIYTIYEGTEYPNNEVNCNYSMNIVAA